MIFWICRIFSCCIQAVHVPSLQALLQASFFMQSGVSFAVQSVKHFSSQLGGFFLAVDRSRKSKRHKKYITETIQRPYENLKDNEPRI